MSLSIIPAGKRGPWQFVTLTAQEMRVAAMVGAGREIENLIEGKRPTVGGLRANNYWSMHILGAQAELALAKYLGFYWSGMRPNRNDGDVGPLEVRWTDRDDGCLLLHPNDPSDRAFVLVTGTGPEFVLRGWAFAGSVKLDHYWRTDTGRPAFFVPQEALFGMEDLKRNLGREGWRSE